MRLIKSERLRSEHTTRLYFQDDDGKYFFEDYKTVRAAISFPYGNKNGLILVGGLRKKSGLIKIIKEAEFDSIFNLADLTSELKKRYHIYCFFRGKDLATEEMVKYMVDDHKFFSCIGIANSKDFDLEIQLVNHYLRKNKLLIPENGFLDAELQSCLDSFMESERKPNGILALFFLILGMEKGDSVFRYGGEEFNENA